MTPNDQRYIVALDALRFLAACLVMMFHLAFWTWAFPEGQVARAAGEGADAFRAWAPLTHLGWIGVQIFFVISGFVIAVTAATARPFRFVVSRVVRLGPGVWICASLTLAGALVVGLDTPSALSNAYLHSMLFWPFPRWVDSVYWTLGVEIAFYLLVFALVALGRFERLKLVVCCIGAGSTVFWVLYALSLAVAPQAHVFLVKVQTSRIAQLLLIPHGCFFALGVMLWWQLMKQHAARHWAWIALFLVGGCLQIAGESVLKLHKTGMSFSPLPACAIWLAAVGLLVLAVRANERLLRWPPATLQVFRRLGLMTYPLYLLHNVGGAIVMAAAHRAGATPAGALASAVLAALAASWAVSAYAEPALQTATRAGLERARAWAAGLARGAPQA